MATLIGTAGGFIGALTLFMIKEWWQSRRFREDLLKNLSYEFDYNIKLFTKYKVDLTEAIEAVGTDVRSVYVFIQYDKIARFFATQFYQAGLLAHYIDTEDMQQWDDFLISMNHGAEVHIADILEKWRSSNIEKEQVFSALKYERDKIESAIKTTKRLKKKINP